MPGQKADQEPCPANLGLPFQQVTTRQIVKFEQASCFYLWLWASTCIDCF